MPYHTGVWGCDPKVRKRKWPSSILPIFLRFSERNIYLSKVGVIENIMEIDFLFHTNDINYIYKLTIEIQLLIQS